MKYLLTLVVAVLAVAAFRVTPAEACEACISDGAPQPTEVACIDSPDGGGEICTSGGGYCNEEGSCRGGVAFDADGSVQTVPGAVSTPSMSLASAGANLREATPATSGTTQSLIRRKCDQAVVARWYAPRQAESLRREAGTLVI